MQDFESLKNIWQHQPPTGKQRSPAISNNKASENTKVKLKRQQAMGGITLVLTAIFIACLAIFGNFNFQHWYTYAAMAIICAICLVQAGVLFFTYQKIKSIDDTIIPALHLQQWEAYYVFRKKQKAVNVPLYYIALNLAMGLYLFEVLSGRPVVNIIIFIAIYVVWMLFAYFYLGKKNLQKEDKRLQAIIDELKGIEKQLNNQD